MLVDEKPPLDEDLLMHFGVPGMKWGHRKARDSGGSGRSSAPKRKMSTKKKVILAGVGAGIAVGAATTAFILAKRGGVRVPKAATVGRIERALQRYPARNVKPILTPYTGAPSPFQMRLDAGMAAHRVSMNRIGAQRMTAKVWSDSAKMAQTIRENAQKSDALTKNLMNSNAELLKALQDPNHIWEL